MTDPLPSSPGDAEKTARRAAAELLDEPALRGRTAPPPFPREAVAAAAKAARELPDEPALANGDTASSGTKPSGDDPNGVWGEPALADVPDATAARLRHAAWVERQWSLANNAPRRLGAFLALALAAGPFAILCAGVREVASAKSILAIAVLGPIAEELGKIAAPLMTLEKKPWLFSSGGSIAVLCALSGLVFASIENLLYFFVYLEDPTPGIILWRLCACTALHVSCSTLSGFGLARVWRRAARDRVPADPSFAASWVIAAVILHGVYNALATTWEFLAPFRV